MFVGDGVSVIFVLGLMLPQTPRSRAAPCAGMPKS